MPPMTGTPASLNDFTVTSSPTPAEPTTANTLLSLINLFAQLAASVGLNFESQSMSCSILPLTPPASFTLLKYARTVSRSTVASTGPVSSKSPPTTTVPPVKACVPACPAPPAPPPVTVPPDGAPALPAASAPGAVGPLTPVGVLVAVDDLARGPAAAPVPAATVVFESRRPSS